ncbi:MAG: deoxyhypusine synthase family protein [Candidatus Omnitrophota bacterium]|nr:deoxyhypusine synthase family protein [Candidatus Omnitrophota bacterium]
MINIKKVKTYSIKNRPSKVNLAYFAKPPARRKSFLGFYDSLPNILKAKEIRAVVNAVAGAYKKKKSVIFMAGAHVIKCGLNPVVIELIKRKIITCIALNGAGIIHDFEIAFIGETSEDVGAGLKTGEFGMARETADFINNAVKEGVSSGLGLGNAVAEKINNSKLRYKNLSILYNAYKNEIPVCVYVAIGADIIHQHPSFDAASAGEGSFRDFYLLVENICALNDGGVVLNFGSAVILPEVFLKALNLARNLGNKVNNFTTANFDMIYHYRPMQNVVSRPVESGRSGIGHYIIGHHEIMLPLLAQAIIEHI